MPFDTTVAHPARRYDYWLGGKDHFPADRESGDAVAAAFPGIRTSVIENRGFLRRAVSYLTDEAGIRQFLDIGTGIPTAHNVHEVAQSIAPDARVVYVDNDPIVLAHARALLTGGTTAYLDADLRDPRAILADPALAAALNLREPVALMLVAVLHFLQDSDDPYGIVRTLVSALPPGSYVTISHATYDFLPPETANTLNTANIPGRGGFSSRPLAAVERFFEGLSLVEPGIVPVSEWRPGDGDARPALSEVAAYGAVARVP